MCRIPEVPVFEGSRVPGPGPVRCVNCGQELFLACGPDSTAAPIARFVGGQSNPNYRLQPKPCAKCMRTFQPTGPRSLFCKKADCDTVAAALRVGHPEHPAARLSP